ncbi:MAG TPA: hypothetical protein VGS07_23635 [Thermoanaerobaculia bacterium]|jgi:hypothetical protein|nr:hypothetical protein [Thermoanaerobaculia bacterium]
MTTAAKVARLLVLGMMASCIVACKAKAPKAPPGLGPKVAPDACAKLTKKDMEAIREAMIEYCEADPRPFYWDSYLQELREVSIYMPGQAESPFPETSLIGLWKCEVRDGHFVMAELGRPPGRTSFGVYLAREGGRWTVRKEFGGYELFRFN